MSQAAGYTVAIKRSGEKEMVDDAGRAVEIVAVGHRRDVYRGL